jgi:tetratricopeptide (TPR) repeat protein
LTNIDEKSHSPAVTFVILRDIVRGDRLRKARNLSKGNSSSRLVWECRSEGWYYAQEVVVTMRLFIIIVCICLLSILTTSAQTRRVPAGNSPQSAAQAFEEGQGAQERGDFNSAVRLYSEAVNADPSLFQAYYQRAMAYLALGRDREAEADLKKVLEMKPDFARAHRAIGQIHLDSGKTEEALRSFAKALELDASLTGVRVFYASALIKNNEPAKAISQLQMAIEKGEKSALAFALLGLAEERTNRLEEAFADYSRAIEMEATSATALEGRARLHEKKGALDKAIADYSASFKVQPSREVALHLASLYGRAGQTQAAISIYRRLLVEKPDDLPARIEMAQLMNENGQPEEAAKEVEKVLAVQPSNARLLELAGDIHFTAKPELAAEYYQRAMQIEPANIRARVQFGASLVRSMKFEQAIPILNEAIARAPSNYSAHANLGTAYFKLKQYAPSAREFIWLINSKPEIAASYYFLAISLDRLGDCAQAFRAYQEFTRRADVSTYKNELEEAKLRLSLLQNLVKEGKCKSPAKGKKE